MRYKIAISVIITILTILISINILGMDEKTRTLVVIHTFILFGNDNCNIRIISARKATKNEQKTYEKG